MPYIELTRPLNAIIAGLTVVLGYFCIDSSIPWAHALADALVLALLAAGGNVHNDIIDLQVDLVNRPSRPVPSGRVRLRYAILLCWGLWTVAIAISAVRGWSQVLVSGAIVGLLVWYNRSLKGKPMVGNAAVALLCATPIAYAALPGLPVPTMWPPILFAFLLTMAREMVKDMEDLAGDRANGLRTLPAIAGIAISGRTATLHMLLVLFALPFPVVVGIFGGEFLLAAAFLCGLPTLAAAWNLRKGQLRRSQSLLKLAMAGGLISAYVGLLLRWNPSFT